MPANTSTKEPIINKEKIAEKNAKGASGNISKENLKANPQTLTASLLVEDAAHAIDMYTHALGAKEIYRMAAPNGKIMHACLMIGNSQFFIADLSPEMGCATPSSMGFYIYTPDVDEAFKKASDAEMKPLYEPKDMFWGDRTGTLVDDFGITWTLATHTRDVSPEEMEKGRQAFFKQAQ
ncbi:MAG: VOC family protein [Proteobacteria bacterium]|nr:VOC family protein [Pseudomonadota bacterium]